MPILTPESEIANLRQSVFKYVETHINTALGILLHYQRSFPVLDMNNMAAYPDQWADIYTERLSPITEVWDAGNNASASVIEYLVQINAFEIRERSTTTFYTLSRLADQISQLFVPKTNIEIRDYGAIGTPIVGYLRAHFWPSVQEIDTGQLLRERLSQVSISSTLWYMSVTT